ncbi:MAG: ABC transporter substrate-binding protein [Spirochaetales bacterium]|nr:ABC transporter substrate-binding protein [Spirochaetales bacterium]
MKKILTVIAVALLSVCLFAQGANEAKTETAKLQTLNVAYMPNYASLCSVVAAMETGAFAEQGLEVKLVEFADGPTIIAAMESGSIDMGYIGAGAHKLCINGRAQIFALSHVGNADAVIALKSHGINSIADLKGKKVGYASGTSSESILKLALESVGYTMNDIKAMEMDASGIVSAMTSGSLDACATWSPSTFTITDAMGSDAITIADNMMFADKANSIASWIVMSKYAKENTDTLLKFTKALYKGMDYRTANVEQTCKWVAKAIAADYDKIYQQRGDAKWITSEELVNMVKDGTVEKLYDVQKKAFGKAANQDAKVADYVMFDNMLNAAK